MRTFSFYHKESGLLNGRTFSSDDDSMLEANFRLHPDHLPIEGAHDHLSKRVDVATGEVEEYMPPPPSSDHVWNPETKRWQLSAAAADKIAMNSAARARIQQLEASQHRRIREHALGKPGAFEALQAIDDEISSLRGQLQ